MQLKKVSVLIVDDSALVRSLLAALISEDARLEVVATANDPFDARDKIKRLMPDIITLDIEMPKMNGIAFLKNLMRLRPMPVVMVSTLTQAGAPATLEALALGAIDYVAKPRGDNPHTLEHYGRDICEKIYWASKANISFKASANLLNTLKLNANSKLNTQFLCAIGASTGGTEAIKNVVSVLPEISPPIVIAQHIPAAFSGSFARRVNNCSAVTVHEAEHQQPIEAGHVYLAPGNAHLLVRRIGRQYICHLASGPEINRHKPSVEPLFDSSCQAAGRDFMSVMLTGMGADGAAAMLRAKQQGAYTLVQDEQTSVVWGMPGAAFKLGAACKVLPLNKIAAAIMQRSMQLVALK